MCCDKRFIISNVTAAFSGDLNKNGGGFKLAFYGSNSIKIYLLPDIDSNQLHVSSQYTDGQCRVSKLHGPNE